VLEAKSEVARREAILIQARNQRDVARDNLRALINYRDPEAAAVLMVEPQDKPTVVPFEVDLQRSLRTALEERPELIAARLDVHSKGLQRKAAENQLLPKLNFTGAVGLNGLSGSNANVISPFPSATPGAVTTIPVNPALEGGYGRALELLHNGRYYNYAAGVSVEIPLDNAQAKAGYAQANVGLEQSRLVLQKLEESVTLEIKTEVSNLQSDLKSIDATRIARELAEENVRNQQARYDVGLATTKDLLDFQDKFTQARFAEIQALTAYNTDLAEMRRVDGTLLSARNILIERIDPEQAPWWASF
jgi:outer membrane protein TolC